MKIWVKEHNPKTVEQVAKLGKILLLLTKDQGHIAIQGYWQLPRVSLRALGKVVVRIPLGVTVRLVVMGLRKCYLGRLTQRGKVICYSRGEESHTSPQCSIKKSKNTNLSYVPRPAVEPANFQADKEPVFQVRLNGKNLLALVDTECSHTLVQSTYIPRESLDEGDTVTVCYVHGDQSVLPSAEVYLEVSNQSFLMKVGVVGRLLYPILLGTYFPVLPDLVKETAWYGIHTVQGQRDRESCRASEWGWKITFNAFLWCGVSSGAKCNYRGEGL